MKTYEFLVNFSERKRQVIAPNVRRIQAIGVCLKTKSATHLWCNEGHDYNRDQSNVSQHAREIYGQDVNRSHGNGQARHQGLVPR